MAFPTTSTVLDAFTRADEGPPPSASWTTVGAAGGLKVVSNALAGNVAGANRGIWNPSTFGPDCEVWITVGTKTANLGYYGLILRCDSQVSRTSYEGYVVTQSGTDTWEIWELTAGTGVKLGTTVTGPELTAGDKIGFEAIGTTLTMYRFNAGAWASVMSRTDATITSAGTIGVYIEGTAARGDDFGGGTVVVAGEVPKTNRLALLGVG